MKPSTKRIGIDLPLALYQRIKALADRDKRSLTKQILFLLEAAVREQERS